MRWPNQEPSDCDGCGPTAITSRASQALAWASALWQALWSRLRSDMQRLEAAVLRYLPRPAPQERFGALLLPAARCCQLPLLCCCAVIRQQQGECRAQPFVDSGRRASVPGMSDPLPSGWPAGEHDVLQHSKQFSTGPHNDCTSLLHKNRPSSHLEVHACCCEPAVSAAQDVIAVRLS